MSKKILSIFLILILLLSNFNLFVYATSTDSLIYSSRYMSSISVAKVAFPNGCENAVLVSGTGIPDGIAASSLAGALNAPILLTQPTNVSAELQQYIKDANIKNIYIIGGTGAVSANVEKTLKNLNINTFRIFGDNRYLSAIEVAKETNKIEPFDKVFIAKSASIDSALASTISGKYNIPILYSDTSTINSDTLNYIKENQNILKVYLIGGFFKDTENQFNTIGKKAEVIYGQDRYGTNSSLNDKFQQNYDNILIVNNNSEVDIISISQLGVQKNARLLLARNSFKYQDTPDNNTVPIQTVNESTTRKISTTINCKDFKALALSYIYKGPATNRIEGGTATQKIKYTETLKRNLIKHLYPASDLISNTLSYPYRKYEFYTTLDCSSYVSSLYYFNTFKDIGNRAGTRATKALLLPNGNNFPYYTGAYNANASSYKIKDISNLTNYSQLGDLKVGDVLWVKGHVDIYIGNGLFAGFGQTGGTLANFKNGIPSFWKWKSVKLYRFANTYEHNGEWTITKNATSTEEGKKERTCTECGEKEIVTIPKRNYLDFVTAELDCLNIKTEIIHTITDTPIYLLVTLKK